jgi:ABC-2 type transport system permease protein
MRPWLIVYRKELSDYVTSKRFVVVLALLVVFTVVNVAVARLPGLTGAGATWFTVVSSLNGSLWLIMPLVGIALGYDSVAGERDKGSIKLLLARPVFRHEILLGKFLAGLVSFIILALAGSLIGYAVGLLQGLPALAAPLAVIVGSSMAYSLSALAFYSVSMLFSVFSSKSSRSLLFSIVFFLVMVFVLPIVGSLVAFSILGPPPVVATQDEGFNMTVFESEEFREYARRQAEITQAFTIVSPTAQASEIASVMTDVLREESMLFDVPRILLPHQAAVVLLAYILVPFLASIAVFNRSEEAWG